MEKHLALMLDYYKDDRSTVHMLKKYLCAYSTGLPGASEFRNRITRSAELDRVLDDAERAEATAGAPMLHEPERGVLP